MQANRVGNGGNEGGAPSDHCSAAATTAAAAAAAWAPAPTLPPGASGNSDIAHSGRNQFHIHTGLRQHDFKGQSEQAISCQNGDSIAKYFVTGGFTAAEIIVIHCRQIIVNQGICMDHFQAAGNIE